MTTGMIKLQRANGGSSFIRYDKLMVIESAAQADKKKHKGAKSGVLFLSHGNVTSYEWVVETLPKIRQLVEVASPTPMDFIEINPVGIADSSADRKALYRYGMISGFSDTEIEENKSIRAYATVSYPSVGEKKVFVSDTSSDIYDQMQVIEDVMQEFNKGVGEPPEGTINGERPTVTKNKPRAKRHRSTKK